MDNVYWFIYDIKYYVYFMKKVDSYIKGIGNEGCDWYIIYMILVFVV